MSPQDIHLSTWSFQIFLFHLSASQVETKFNPKHKSRGQFHKVLFKSFNCTLVAFVVEIHNVGLLIMKYSTLLGFHSSTRKGLYEGRHALAYR